MKPLFLLAVLVTLAGCASGSPPTAFERTIYNVTTQRVEVVILRTNVTATATNVVAVPSVIEIPILETKPVVTDTLGVATGVATTMGFGWAAPLGALIMTGLAGWASYRNSRNKKLANVLAQNVETAREVIKMQPGGSALDSKFKMEIKAQQVDADVKDAAAAVADDQVNSVKANAAAERVMKPVLS